MSAIVKPLLYMIKLMNKLVLIINALLKMKEKGLYLWEEKFIKIELWDN